KGPRGEPRRPSDSQPEPGPGESQRQSVALTLDNKKHTAVGELTLSDKDDDQVYWQQAFYVGGQGTKQWAAGNMGSLVLPPAERRPTSLVTRHQKSRRTLELESKATYRIGGSDDDVHEQSYYIRTSLIETTNKVKGGVADVVLEYGKMQMA